MPVGVDNGKVADAVAAYVKLVRASRAVLDRVAPRLAGHRLTQTQFGVLEVLLHQGPLPHGDLGRKVLSSAGNMTDVVDKLEARGLVRRTRDSTDRRTVRVALTDAGRSLVSELFPRHAQDIARAMSGLSADELAQLGPLLRKLGMAAARGGDEDTNLAGEAHPA